MTFQQGLQYQASYAFKGELGAEDFQAERYYCNLGISLFELGILDYNHYYITETPPSMHDIKIKRAMLKVTHNKLYHEKL